MASTDEAAAQRDLDALSAKYGWYVFYKACLRYVKGKHTLLTIPDRQDIPLWGEVVRVLETGINERENSPIYKGKGSQ